jgi:hypothetical protein
MNLSASPSATRTLDKVLLIAMVVLAAFTVVSSVVVILWTYNVIPVQDHWVTVDLYRAWLEGGMDWRLLWSQHNEHRLLFPRFFFLLDYLVAAGTQWMLVPAMLALQGAHAWLLGRAFRRTRSEGRVTGADHAFFAATAFTLLFWLIQSGNLSWGFQIQWTLNALFVSLAAWLVCGLEKETPRAALWKTLLLAALCCVVATYSLANGIFMAGILLVWIWKAGPFENAGRRALFFWLLFCVALGVSYLAGYHSPAEQSSPLDGFRFRTLHHVVVYLGNPISRLYRPAGSAAGILGLVLFLFFLRRVLTEKRPAFFLRFGVAHLTYVIITATVTALGRGDVGVEQASSSRYFTTGLIFWFFQLAMTYALLGSAGKFARPFRAGLVALFLFVLIPVQIGAVPHRQREHRLYDDAGLAFIAGVEDTVSMTYLYQYYALDTLTWSRNAFLKRHRLSVYREAWTHTLGKELSGVYPLEARSLAKGEAAIVRESRVPGREGYYVEGRVGTAGEETPRVILFVNSGKITGYAKTAHRPCKECFSGYVRGAENRDFEMFALDPRTGNVRRVAGR